MMKVARPRPPLFISFSTLLIFISCFHRCPSPVSASTSPPPLLNLQNCTSSSCGSLSNISFPFSLDSLVPNTSSSSRNTCGLPEFRLNCSSSSSSSSSGTVSWWPDASKAPICSISNITSNHVIHGTFVTAAPVTSSPVNACNPVEVGKLLSSPPPLPIGLEFFPYNNIVLLLNCSSELTKDLRVNDTIANSFSFSSPNCLRYYSICYYNDNNATTPVPCLEAISADANVTHVKKSYGCAYNLSLFEIPTKLDMAVSLQMAWTISQSYYDCRACEGSNGSCSIDDATGGFQCSCPADRAQSPTNVCGQSSPSSCKGLCQSSIRIFLGAMAISAAIVIGTAGLFAYCQWHKRQTRPCGGGGRKQSSSSSSKDKFKQMMVKEVGPFPETTQTFTFKELFEASNGFSEGKLLGDGGFGTVYEGTIASTGQKVAVKRLYSENKHRLEQFLNEIRILSTLNHPNLVKLHGFCCESYEQLLLVYEFAPNGSLADNLHGMAGKGLLWETRLCIALETARALVYLHQRDPPILHRDVKSSNILLDENFHAKLGDFGLSRRVSYSMKSTHVSTAPQGTPGYVDPQYQQCHQLTDKSDVYSFGVVLIELISGKAPVDMSRGHTHANLSSLAVAKIQMGALHELIDPFVEAARYPAVHHMVTRVAELAFLCLAPLQEDRPSMSSVALTLLQISDESAYPPPSSNTSLDDCSMSLFDKPRTWPNSTNSTMDSGCCSSTTTTTTHTDPDIIVPSTATSPDFL